MQPTPATIGCTKTTTAPLVLASGWSITPPHSRAGNSDCSTRWATIPNGHDDCPVSICTFNRCERLPILLILVLSATAHTRQHYSNDSSSPCLSLSGFSKSLPGSSRKLLSAYWSTTCFSDHRKRKKDAQLRLNPQTRIEKSPRRAP